MCRIGISTNRLLPLALLILAPVFIIAQEIKPRFDRNETLTEALTWQYQDSVELALAEYRKIPFNDSAFVFSALEQSHMLLNNERPEEALAIAERGLEMPEEKNSYKLQINKGVALNDLERYDEALAHWDNVMAMYPNASRFKYNKAMTYRAMEDHQKALDLLKEVFFELPYYPNTHLMLGNYASSEGRTAQALMCYDMFLVMENNTQSALDMLSFANEFVSRKLEKEPKDVVLSETGDDFEEIDLVLDNYVALKKGYNASPSIELAFIKQNHLMHEMLDDHKSDGGFWSDHYVPFFKDVWNNSAFEGFMYHCLVPSQSKQHQKLVAKNQSQIDRFLNVSTEWIAENWATKEATVNGEKGMYRHWYNEQGELQAIGNVDQAKRQVEGPFSYFHPNGRLLKEGVYNDMGELEGTWKTFYANGNKHEIFGMNSSVLEGPFELFFANGAKRESGNYKDGKSEGEGTMHYGNGSVSSIKNYADDKMHGQVDYFYLNGKKSSESSYKEGERDGPLKTFHRDGSVKIDAQFKDNERIGTSKEYFADGSVRSVYEFENGVANGPFKEYHSNGQLQSEGRMKEGVLIGEYKSYFIHGALDQVIVYDEEGKKNGLVKQMDEDGKLHSEFEYKKDDIIAYKYFDKQGNVLKEARKKGGEFMVESHFPTGELSAVGLYEYGGGKTGDWKYYHKDGSVRSEEFFEDNLLQGISKNYHKDGSLSWLGEYTDGQLDGYYAEMDPTGTLRVERWYNKGDREGVSYSYFPDGTLEGKYYYDDGDYQGVQEYYAVNGKLDRKEIYDMGFRMETIWFDTLGNERARLELPNASGKYTTPNFDGSPQFIGNYVNGWAEGDFKWFFADGSVSSHYVYKNDSRNGRSVSYFENGKLESDKTLVDGLVDGVSKWYHDNGQLSSEWNYIKDQAHGLQKGYHENGKTSAVRNYEWGSEHGKVEFFGEDGELELVRYYERGTLVGYSYMGSDGKLVDTIPIVATTGRVDPFYGNGKPARKMEFKNGEINGEFKKFHSNGKLSLGSVMMNGEENGTETEYYPNGNVRYIEQYIYGTLHGKCEYFYENGKKKEVLNYLNGSLHGTCAYYDENTGNASTKFYYDGYEYK